MTTLPCPTPATDMEPGSTSNQETRCSEESSLIAGDGQEIFYRVWRPSVPSDNAVVLFHRGHEHSERWQDFVDRSGLDDCWIFAWDARGHGRSGGDLTETGFSRMVADVEDLAQHLRNEYGIEKSNLALVAQSVGAVMAAAWVHDYAPPVRAMVLSAPAFRVKLYVPLAIPMLRLLHWLRPHSYVKSYVRPKMLTHDEQRAAQYASDDLVNDRIAVNVLLDLHDTSTRLVDDAASIHTPTLLFVPGNDKVVRKGIQHQFFDNLSSRGKQLVELDGFYHDVFSEVRRGDAIDQTTRFLRKQFDAPSRRLDSTTLASGSASKYESLCKPASLLSRLWFGIQWLMLATLGRLSRGVQIGWQSGFDSGQSLDHVYRNRAEGITPIGRMIDRGYLDSIGWKGIRHRKGHMEQMLDEAIAGAVEEFGEVTIVDIAAGPGRYVLETLQRNKDLPVKAILCDRDLGGIAEGRALAKELGLEDRAEFRQSDAFDSAAIADAVGDNPVQIAIVSGLYELFPDNEMIKQSLAGVANVLAPGGWLLYTDQPWHPQQEMIARVLPNRDGEPWIMRCRSQAEMDALVREAGMQPQRLLLDKWGIFSVALARKNAEARTGSPQS